MENILEIKKRKGYRRLFLNGVRIEKLTDFHIIFGNGTQVVLTLDIDKLTETEVTQDEWKQLNN